MESFVLYLLVYLIEGLIFFQYCASVFQRKRSRPLSFSFFFVIYLAMFLISRLQLVWLNTASFFLLNVLILIVLYWLPLSSALFHTAIATVLMGVSELVVISVSSHFINSFEYVKTLSSMRPVIMMVALSKLLYFLLLMAVAISFGKKTGTLQAAPTISLHFMIIPLISCFMAVTFATIGLTSTLLDITEWMITLSAFLLLLLNIISIALYDYYQEKQRQYDETQMLLQMEHDSSEYYKMLRHESESRSVLIHDIKKHLQSLYDLSGAGDQNAVRQYIDNLSDNFGLDSTVRLSDSELLNAMLLRYRRQCAEANISFETDIRYGALNFLSDEDITSLFGNLLDNAFDAASASPNAFIECNADLQEDTTYTMVTMRNSCTVKPPMNEDGIPLSKKTTAGFHGFGIKSVLRVVEKYGGSSKFYFSDKEKAFHTIILLRRQQVQLPKIPGEMCSKKAGFAAVHYPRTQP